MLRNADLRGRLARLVVSGDPSDPMKAPGFQGYHCTDNVSHIGIPRGLYVEQFLPESPESAYPLLPEKYRTLVDSSVQRIKEGILDWKELVDLQNALVAGGLRWAFIQPNRPIDYGTNCYAIVHPSPLFKVEDSWDEGGGEVHGARSQILAWDAAHPPQTIKVQSPAKELKAMSNRQAEMMEEQMHQRHRREKRRKPAPGLLDERGVVNIDSELRDEIDYEIPSPPHSLHDIVVPPDGNPIPGTASKTRMSVSRRARLAAVIIADNQDSAWIGVMDAYDGVHGIQSEKNHEDVWPTVRKRWRYRPSTGLCFLWWDADLEERSHIEDWIEAHHGHINRYINVVA